MKTGIFNRAYQKIEAWCKQKEKGINIYTFILGLSVIVVMILMETFTTLEILYEINAFLFYSTYAFVFLTMASAITYLIVWLMFGLLKTMCFFENKLILGQD